jgi:HK97 gp10 family phage protein
MMANSGMKLDKSEWDAALNKLSGPVKEKLARSMGVAGGQVMRDEAKLQAPVMTGLLSESIYLAFKDDRSNDAQVVYSVSWNSKTAPHGHLLEFGHWHVTGGKGGEQTSWTAAKPFLRPAYDIAKPKAAQAMMARGKVRAAELLAEMDSGN